MSEEHHRPPEIAADTATDALPKGVKPVFTISVRDLVEYALRTGDLGGDRDFVSPSRALEGTRGHQRVQKSRPAGYNKEVPLQYDAETPDFVLRIQGRVDGILGFATGLEEDDARCEDRARRPDLPQVIVEEIKTVYHHWNGEPDPLHWAQVKIYGAMYLAAHPSNTLALRLVYLDLDTDLAREFQRDYPRGELAAFLDSALAPYRLWMESQWAWQLQRNASIRRLAFPFAQYRPGQRPLAVAVYRAAKLGQNLFASAPTGIGKTMSVLYPALKTLPEGHCAKIFYLTARTSGRQAAEQAVAEMRRSGLRLRSITLTAKQQICFQSTGLCETKTCPYAIGYFDRVKKAVAEALDHELLTRPVVEEVARRHQVCPFELSLDAALWADVVIGDYNYVMDPRAYLRRFFAETREDYLFLVDEAHNLVDRAREMFSAALDKEEVLALRRALHPRGDAGDPEDPNPPAPVPLQDLRLQDGMDEAAQAPRRSDTVGMGKALNKINRAFLELRHAAEADRTDSLIRIEMPETWKTLLRLFMGAAETWLAQDKPAPFREALIQFYFKVAGFLRCAELYDDHFLTLWQNAPERLRLFCLDPANCLQKALERGRAAVFFSATLAPLDYFKEMLGGRLEDAELWLDSPFPPEHLGLFVQDRIATNYRAREATFDAVAEAIGTFITARLGNYLVFFPSYQYLNQVLERFRRAHPNLALKAQTPGMTALESEAFLAAFQCQPTQTQAGFAVMGGLFGEGIDLVGDRLTGAVVVGVGLPQIGLERDLIRNFFQERRGAGFEYAYLFPGMNRVLQAAGRVIRSETDRGVVLLIDARFAEARFRRLFPPWWQPRTVRDASEMKAALEEFWGATSLS